MWKTLTIKDVQTYLGAAQVKALQQRGLASGQEDPLAAALDDIAGRVRAELRAVPGLAVSATPAAVPDELRATVVALTIEAAAMRFPALVLSDLQRSAAQEARALLERVGKGQVRVLPPENPEAGPPARKSAEVVQSRPRLHL